MSILSCKFHRFWVSAFNTNKPQSSLVGHEGVQRQHGFVKAIPSTNVKLFVPSDLGIRALDEQGLRVPVNKTKDGVEKAAKDAGIPTTVVVLGCFAESAFSIG